MNHWGLQWPCVLSSVFVTAERCIMYSISLMENVLVSLELMQVVWNDYIKAISIIKNLHCIYYKSNMPRHPTICMPIRNVRVIPGLAGWTEWIVEVLWQDILVTEWKSVLTPCFLILKFPNSSCQCSCWLFGKLEGWTGLREIPGCLNNYGRKKKQDPNLRWTNDIHSYDTRKKEDLFIVPCNTSLCKNNFINSGLHMLNHLPPHLKEIPVLCKFKNSLK
jgi:hypothetical protein